MSFLSLTLLLILNFLLITEKNLTYFEAASTPYTTTLLSDLIERWIFIAIHKASRRSSKLIPSLNNIIRMAYIQRKYLVQKNGLVSTRIARSSPLVLVLIF